MQIAIWDTSDPAKLTGFYNEQIAPIPYCFTVTPEEFDLGFDFLANPWPEEDNTAKELANYSERKLIVAEQNGAIVGFADVGKQLEETAAEIGLIRTMMYRPGYRSIGQAILAQAEQYFRDLGLNEIQAFTKNQYSFFRFGARALPHPMWHVHALFGMNNYQFASFANAGGKMGWFFFHWPEYHISEPSPPDSTSEIVVKHMPGRSESYHLEIKAYRQGKPMASAWSAAAESYCLNSAARKTFITDDVHVEENYQGKGWGRYLMQRTLWEMKKLGYRNATLNCSLPNYRAQLLYTNLGYRVVDYSCAFTKDLAANSPG